MANAQASASASGVGFPGLLTLLFIGLKLTGYIEWSWLWVLSPIWMGLLLVLLIIVVMLVMLVLAVIGHFIDRLRVAIRRRNILNK